MELWLLMVLSVSNKCLVWRSSVPTSAALPCSILSSVSNGRSAPPWRVVYCPSILESIRTPQGSGVTRGSSRLEEVSQSDRHGCPEPASVASHPAREEGVQSTTATRLRRYLNLFSSSAIERSISACHNFSHSSSTDANTLPFPDSSCPSACLMLMMLQRGAVAHTPLAGATVRVD